MELRMMIPGCTEPSWYEIVVETRRSSAGGVLPFPKRSRREVPEENDVGCFCLEAWAAGEARQFAHFRSPFGKPLSKMPLLTRRPPTL